MQRCARFIAGARILSQARCLGRGSVPDAPELLQLPVAAQAGLHLLHQHCFWQSSTPAAHYSNSSGSSSGGGTITTRLAEAGDRGDLGAVLEVVESDGVQLDAAGVESALVQVERCTKNMAAKELEAVHANKSFQMLADMAVSIAGSAPPELLASTIAVMGRLGFANQLVLDELGRGLMNGVHELDPEHLQQVVEGLRRADHSPGVLLLDAVYERLQELQGLGPEQVQQHQADAIMADLKSLGHDDTNPTNPEAQRQPERIKYT